MNCKPGDLAIVVRCESSPKCVGMLVEVLEIVSAYSVRMSQDGVLHENDFPDSAYFVRSMGGGFPEDLALSHLPSNWSMFGLHCLRPIRPGDMQDEVIDSKELEAA